MYVLGLDFLNQNKGERRGSYIDQAKGQASKRSYPKGSRLLQEAKAKGPRIPEETGTGFKLLEKSKTNVQASSRS